MDGTVTPIIDTDIYKVVALYQWKYWSRTSPFRYKVELESTTRSGFCTRGFEHDVILIPTPKKPKHKITVNTRRSW